VGPPAGLDAGLVALLDGAGASEGDAGLEVQAARANARTSSADLFIAAA
jgi:hypothetical protein